MPESKEFGSDPDLFEAGNTASTNCTDKLFERAASEDEDSFNCSIDSDHLVRTEKKVTQRVSEILENKDLQETVSGKMMCLTPLIPRKNKETYHGLLNEHLEGLE